MYYQFLFGGGDKWLFGSQILSVGDGGTRPSDTERLILNTLSWLAQPSLSNTSSGIGGYVQDSERLIFPNEQPKIEAQLNETHYPYNKQALSEDPAKGDGTSVFTGLIGAQSVHGGGTSTVAEYAVAATAAGLSFVALLSPTPRSQMHPSLR